MYNIILRLETLFQSVINNYLKYTINSLLCLEKIYYEEFNLLLKIKKLIVNKKDVLTRLKA